MFHSKLPHFILLLLPFIGWGQSPIWSENFVNGIPSTWTQSGSDTNARWEYRGPATNPNTTVGSRGYFSTPRFQAGGPPLASSTANNGFVIFDSDFLDNGGLPNRGLGASPAPHWSLLQTNSIDLSSHPQVVLDLETYFDLDLGQIFLLCSTDGGLSFNDTIPIISHQAGPFTYPANAQAQSYNLSQYIGGQSNVVLGFLFDGQNSNLGLSGYHYWMLDDLVLRDGPRNSLSFFQPNPQSNPIQLQLFDRAGNSTDFRSLPIRFANEIELSAAVYNNGSRAQTNLQLEVTIYANNLLKDICSFRSAKYAALLAGDTLSFGNLSIREILPWHVSSYELHCKLLSDSIPDSLAPSWIWKNAYTISSNSFNHVSNPDLNQVLLSVSSGNGAQAIAIPFHFKQEDPDISTGGKIAFSGIDAHSYTTGTPDSMRYTLYADGDFNPQTGVSAGANSIWDTSLITDNFNLNQAILLDTGRYWMILEQSSSATKDRYFHFRSPLYPSESRAVFQNSSGTWSQQWNSSKEMGNLHFAMLTEHPGCPNRDLLTFTVCDTGQIYVPILNRWVNQSGVYYDTGFVGGCLTYRQHYITILRPPSDTIVANTCSFFYSAPSGTVFRGPGQHIDRVVQAQGCDHYYYINHSINGVPIIDTVQACGEYYLSPWGQKISASGSYEHVIQSANSCDTVFLIELDFSYLDLGIHSVNGGTGAKAEAQGATFQWIDCLSGQAIFGATDSLFYPSYNGNFAVVVNNGTCVDTSDCLLLATNDLAQFTNQAIAIYPNPSQQEINIELAQRQDDWSISIHDSRGAKLIYRKVKGDSKLKLKHQLPAGVYQLQIELGTQIISRSLLVK